MKKLTFLCSLFFLVLIVCLSAQEVGTTFLYSEEDPTLLVARIEENGMMTTYHYHANRQCSAIFQEYQNKIILRSFYFYNEEGFLEEVIVDDGTEQECDQLIGVTERKILHFDFATQFPCEGKLLRIKNTLLNVKLSEV